MSIEKKVGIFVLITLVTLAATIEMFEAWNPFEVRHRFTTYVTSSVGLSVGDQVRMAGVPVGKVESIDLSNNRVKIGFYVVEGTMIKDDALAEVRRTNLLGGSFLGISIGSEGAGNVLPGAVIPSRQIASVEELIDNLNRNQERVLGKLADIIEENRQKVNDTLTNVDAIAEKINSGEGTAGKLVNDPKLYDDLRDAAASLKIIAARLEKGEGTIGRLMKDPSLYDETLATMRDLKAISGKIRSGEGTLGRLVQDEEFYTNLNEAFAAIRDIAQRAQAGEGTLGKLLTDEELYYDTKETMARVRSIATKIDAGEGAVGQLVNNDDLYRDAKTTLNKVEKAADSVRDSGTISALGTAVGTLF